MKKFIVMALILLGLISNVSAGSAPAAYEWEVLDIYSSSVPNGEYVYGSQTSTSQDHNGEMIFRVLVKGYSSTVVSTYNNQPLTPFQIDGIDATGDGFYDMWLYYYYVPSMTSGYVNVQDFGTRDSIYVK